MAQITYRSISKQFAGHRAIHDIDIEVADGEFMVFVGPSGCGKSTLLRMLAGLVPVSAGQILLDGEDITDLPPKDRDLAMVFQNYALYPHMTAAENIGFPLRVQRMPKAERSQRVEEIAAMLGLENYLDRYPRELSGGQRQRVAMGRAIVRHPRVFLFDEPLSNLDAALRVQMRKEIKLLHNRIGATTIYVTHDQVEAMTMADRIVVLRDGRVEQCASAREIYARPANEFVACFIGSPPMNLIECSYSGSDAGLVATAGSSFRLPLPPLGEPPPQGTVIRVGIRPEDIVMCGTTCSASDAGAGTALQGRVTYVEQSGQDVAITLDLGWTSLTASTRGSVAPLVGETLAVTWPSKAIMAFDGHGKRIEPC